jgi:hypothetical protein
MAPQGSATGLYAHPFVWVAAGAAVVQLALLLVRHYPGGRLRVPGDGILLAVGSGLVCLIVAAGVVFIPGPWADILSVNGALAVPFQWEGTPAALDGYTLVMTWSYGAPAAMAAALASLALTIAALAGRTLALSTL